MLPKIGRLVFLVTLTLLFSLYIPEFYWLKFSSPKNKPVIYYSPVLHDFIFGITENEKFEWRDNSGNKFTRAQFEELTPGLNFRQLYFEKKLPDSVDNIYMNIDSLKLHRLILRITPYMVSSSQIQLYPLMESQSGRVKLSVPDDYFRIDEKGITFIDAKLNQINEEKSSRFTKVMLDENFTFPAKLIAGNPSTMKPFDDGYYILDSSDKLFHLKMIKGEPFFRYMNNPPDIKIKFINFSENNLRKFYAVVISEDNQVYLIFNDNYTFFKAPVESFDITNNKLILYFDYLNKSYVVDDDKSVVNYTSDKNWKYINNYKFPYYNPSTDPAVTAANVLFPFTFSIVDGNNGMIDLFFKMSNWKAVWGLIISAAAAYLILRKRKAASGLNYFDVLLAGLTGIFGLLAVILIKNVE